MVGAHEAGQLWELQARRASAWTWASDFRALLVLSNISPPEREISLHLELISKNFVNPPPHLFANKKMEGGLSAFSRSPASSFLLSCLPALPLPFSP